MSRIQGQGRNGMIRDRIRTSIDSDSNWLITFSDVMTLLLIFFVVFFFAKLHTADENTNRKDLPAAINLPSPVTSGSITAMAHDVSKEIDNLKHFADMSDDISIEAIERGMIVTLREKVTFRPGDARLLRESEAILDSVADILKHHASYMIEINGHTDNVPINTPGYPSNWELSVARAASVLKYFINRHGIDPARFSIKGDGEQRPVVANDSPDHRAQNRRVEIKLREREEAL